MKELQNKTVVGVKRLENLRHCHRVISRAGVPTPTTSRRHDASYTVHGNVTRVNYYQCKTT